MGNSQRTPTEQILDLLLDALQERQKARDEAKGMRDEGKRQKDIPEETSPPLTPQPLTPTPHTSRGTGGLRAAPTPEPPTPTPQASRLTPHTSLPTQSPISNLQSPPSPLPSIQLDQMLGRLLLVLIALVVIINIPFNRHGTNLARLAPDSAALVIRDGLLLKGSGPEVYVLQDERLRWITTLDAFEWYGYRWEQVHEVEDSFLTDFEPGLPIHLLLKCPTSPHVYALEDGRKRWIKDIPTFEAQQYLWEDIKLIDCASLRHMPDGLPIPEDAGPPPQP